MSLPQGAAFKLRKNPAGEFEIVPFDESILPEPRNAIPAEGTADLYRVKKPTRRGRVEKLHWDGHQLIAYPLGANWHHYPGQSSDEELDDEYGSDNDEDAPFAGSSCSVSARHTLYRDAPALTDSAETATPSTTPSQSRHSSLGEQDADKRVFYGRFDSNGNWVTRVGQDKDDGPQKDEMIVSKPAPLPSDRERAARIWWEDTGRVRRGESEWDGHLGCLNWAEDRGLIAARFDSPKEENKVPTKTEAAVGSPFIWPVPAPSRL